MWLQMGSPVIGLGWRNQILLEFIHHHFLEPTMCLAVKFSTCFKRVKQDAQSQDFFQFQSTKIIVLEIDATMLGNAE